MNASTLAATSTYLVDEVCRDSYRDSMKLRMTHTLRAVLDVLLEGTGEDLHGLEICKRAGLGTGTTYPILSRLERAGLITARWEDETAWQQPADGRRRPRRRYYELTGAGRLAAQESAAACPRSTPRLRSSP
jgi:DNA-binding PadR family transcriptional regulator